MSQQPYYVIEMQAPGRAPQTFSFAAPRVVIGRDAGELTTGDGQCSASHAEIEFRNGQLVVRDLGSSNGSWKDGQPLPQFAISAGEEFKCGNTVFKVTHTIGGAPQASGGTVMGDANAMAELRRARAAAAGAAAPAVAPTPEKRGMSTGLLVGLGAVAIAVVGGGGFAAYTLLQKGPTTEEPPAVVAKADVEEEVEEEVKEEAPKGPAHVQAPVVYPKTVDGEEIVEKNMGELYEQVAAATVVIRVPGSVGSGAIVDPSGIILTNHHVIDGGEREGLRIKAKVVLGAHSEETAAFEPAGDPLEAYVLAVDEAHDLALIKLEDPPKDLPSLKLSSTKPFPGMKVAAVGHAGAGLLWAIKGGEISGTGQLGGHTGLEIAEATGSYKEFLGRIKSQMDKKGLVIQSTAKILPGDSGGPLVSMTGEIVGVNAFTHTDRKTSGVLSFHVHLSEVQAFMKDIPSVPLDFIPDPWGVEAKSTRWADADLDGTTDTLKVETDGGAFEITYVDLDQDSFKPSDSMPNWDELVVDGKSKFDAEMVVMVHGSKWHFLYDTTGDGYFDVYMLDDDGDGSVSEAFRRSPGGAAERDDSVKVDDGVGTEPFTDEALKKRLDRVGSAVFPGRVKRGGKSSAPNPLGSVAKYVPSYDRDGDGTRDTFVEESALHRRIFWDADQSGGKDDAEAVAIVQGTTVWVWYDTDDDGGLDLMLRGTNAKTGIATRAFVWDGKAGAQVKGHLGRLLLRPDLLGTGPSSLRLATIAAAGGLAEGTVADAGGVASFPSVAVSSTASVNIESSVGLEDAVATTSERSHDLVLVDIDRNSVKKAKTRADVAKLVRAGDFDAEVAILTLRGLRWVFYDTDGKAGFDLVLAGERDEKGPVVAYKVKGETVTETDGGTHLLQWGRFRGAQSEALESLARAKWPAQSGAD
ncbi:MAG: trypsin-like peptidase domain-containing protein [Myxococcota bacterium]